MHDFVISGFAHLGDICSLSYAAFLNVDTFHKEEENQIR